MTLLLPSYSDDDEEGSTDGEEEGSTDSEKEDSTDNEDDMCIWAQT